MAYPGYGAPTPGYGGAPGYGGGAYPPQGVSKLFH